MSVRGRGVRDTVPEAGDEITRVIRRIVDVSDRCPRTGTGREIEARRILAHLVDRGRVASAVHHDVASPPLARSDSSGVRWCSRNAQGSAGPPMPAVAHPTLARIGVVGEAPPKLIVMVPAPCRSYPFAALLRGADQWERQECCTHAR